MHRSWKLLAVAASLGMLALIPYVEPYGVRSAAGAAYGFHFFGRQIEPVPLPVAPLPAVALTLPINFYISAALLRWRDRRKANPLGLCPKCAYNLTANQTRICPECGEPITPVAA